jgi:hypothetical protein
LFPETELIAASNRMACGDNRPSTSPGKAPVATLRDALHRRVRMRRDRSSRGRWVVYGDSLATNQPGFIWCEIHIPLTEKISIS